MGILTAKAAQRSPLWREMVSYGYSVRNTSFPLSIHNIFFGSYKLKTISTRSSC